jgi:hypothetical protein
MLFSLPSHCIPSSEAGCKSRKNYQHTKQLDQLICITSLIRCFSSGKNSSSFPFSAQPLWPILKVLSDEVVELPLAGSNLGMAEERFGMNPI